ncbi:4-amino-4-deoxy-L-arabinose-phosphoundecaprenol flippase subunit ArnF [Providencia sp. JGM181]|jgi:undecaprenyl phosphate-alpha-L-ara4N flippase subunit ArnF|uniref:4-amino-4-deoxy-L-arabinose-phosphoundecaprenol flippase subunit ArnF n=1 Tax=unclassified Providencia TaxID=2633465 RepID=UPI001BA4A524|nr:MULTISPECIES: 4-amino-4-deoxy-L-arabinose-phosphoundecaprenol flippase subunit ArnF [unclassified Providencia]MBS0924777.1 4-amino-4-deoxy-L-arabinose-phosphoundecaprenol flippase subunit ArnF [Providencia sp. JGM181]MBS0932312.1 4-amino-4-deoxy-L-arabinose-phosphoundecaprenol flippase subunit ArnF [Providencia sp. JGM172]MBS0996505.1 4-amino-4-deoxy-L-arabinose-phosphoundecaprenol flippase subunit ArnF [Providencia sp. JGM178]
MNKGYLWVLGSALLVTVAQLSLKAGVVELPSFTLGWHWLQLEWLADNAVSLGTIFVGLVCYALSMLCWLFALKYIALNKAYPLISLSYVFVYILAVVLPWFNEPATVLKAAGIAFILLGVWLISRPSKPLTKKAK